MSEGIEKLVRPDLAALKGYSACAPPEVLEAQGQVPGGKVLKLDANENPYGCSPKVFQALGRHTGLHIYPDATQTELRKMLAGYVGLKPENIVAGNGSDELIDLLLCLLVTPGDEVITCTPTFDMYRFSTITAGGKVVDVPRGEEFQVDTVALKAAVTERTRLIFLANPNNPTGTLTSRQDIVEILKLGVPTVIDEAYCEFSGHTAVPLTHRYENLMVLRTFSKWAGLAGLRIGFGVFPKEIAAYLLNIKPPYNVNVAAEAAVRASFEDIEYLRDRVVDIIREREKLFRVLQTFKWLKPVPSKSNFIFCRVVSGEVAKIRPELEKRGVLLRYFEHPRLRDGFRVSIGRPDQNEAFVSILREIGEING